jgi:type IV secretion system protein VirB10
VSDTSFDPAADTDPPLDRAISPIAGWRSTPGAGKGLAFAGLLVGCGAVALATWSAEPPKPRTPRATPARQVVAFEPAKAPPALATAALAPPALNLSGTELPRPERPAGERVPALEGDAASAPAANFAATHSRAAPRHAPLMVFSRSAPALTEAAQVPSLPGLPADRAGAAAPDDLRRVAAIVRARAAPVGDRNFLILAGTTIPCILQTAIDTTTAGFVTCLIDRDVYSDNGAVVLLAKGARVLGEYRSGLRQGQDRVFVAWSRAVSPDGVAIALASPASDSLGRAGFGGAVDTHFWDRFGAAALLSVFDAGAAGLADRDGGVATIRLPNEAAAVAVRQGADIPPTLRKAQGGVVAIQVTQDLDFSAVYGLAARP